MALGGGIWTTQNKILPGSYINFSSVSRASATLSERGTVAMPLMLDWGPDGAIFEVTAADFQKNSQKIFGHASTADAMLPLRELFKHTKTLYAYRLLSGGVKAFCVYATAKYSGTRGNDLKIVITANVDDNNKFDVSTLLDTNVVDTQIVATAAELVANDFVTFSPTATLELTASTPLASGTNGEALNGEVYQDFLDKIESYSFNVLGCPSMTGNIRSLFTAFTRRMRDEIGAKFQCVVWQGADADFEGVISVENTVSGYDTNIMGMGDYGLVYWMSGAAASCEVNRSNTNKQYNGELTVLVNYTQSDLEAAIKAGKLIFHNVNSQIRLLEDINTLVTLGDTKGAIFQANQTIRVIDQIANDAALLFNTRYLGVVPNDASGRISLWNDICRLHQELETIRAIENFDTGTVTVAQGNTKRAVVCTVSNLNIINAMSQLYMSVIIE